MPNVTLKRDEQNLFDDVAAAIEDILNGKIIIVVDDEDRENEGDFIMAADKATPDAINFMITHGRGLLCVSLTRDIIKKLKIYSGTEHPHAAQQPAQHKLQTMRD